jgi:putative addiction module component (TIGR02574 family)
MKKSTADLFRHALDLKEEDRATLAGLLIESLEEKSIENLESIWKAEISRRISELDSGKVEGIPWEEVKEKLLKTKND